MKCATADVAAIERSLDDWGFAALGRLLGADACAELASMYSDDARFRSRIDMSRFRFGSGEYKYFAAPLPPVVQQLRSMLYERLAPIANQWASAFGRSQTFPSSLDAFLSTCHRAGQERPTPLLLSYRAGDYNCLHQDVYGDLVFPLQVVIGLKRPGEDYTGGEFLLVEQRPRAQSRGHAITIAQGDAVAFATRERPVTGTRGVYRVTMRHGVSTIASGARMTLGIIFHDAR